MSYQRATTRFIPDSTPRDLLSQEFEIDAFIKTLKHYLSAQLAGVDIWDMCVFELTKGKMKVMPFDQRGHLYDWIKSNWTWFTESFSDRQRFYLTQKLLSLKGE